MKTILTAACLSSLFSMPALAQRLEVSIAIDLQARETTFTWGVWGDAHSGGSPACVLFGEWAVNWVPGPPFVGRLLVGGNKVDLSPPVTMDARGYASYAVRTPALALGNQSAAVQGCWIAAGLGFMTDNRVLTGHWTNADASQILAAQHNSENGAFRLRGRYRSGVELIVWRRNPGDARWTAVATHPAGLSPDVSLATVFGLSTGSMVEVRHGATVLLSLR